MRQSEKSMTKKLFSLSRPNFLTLSHSLGALPSLLDSQTAQAVLLTETDKSLTIIPTVAKRLLVSANLANPSLTRQKCAESSTLESSRCERLMLSDTECLSSTLSLELVSTVRNVRLRSTTLATLLTHNFLRGRTGCTNRLETSQQQVVQRRVCTTPTVLLRPKS